MFTDTDYANNKINVKKFYIRTSVWEAVSGNASRKNVIVESV
jgi:hypothetical protein